jgi:hypothetical protein
VRRLNEQAVSDEGLRPNLRLRQDSRDEIRLVLPNQAEGGFDAFFKREASLASDKPDGHSEFVLYATP